MKLKKKSGFTLIEMLVVVAIIAVLVAVSIPMVNNSLEKAREATDAANERAAKAEILLVYMNDEKVGASDFASGTEYYYNAEKGTLVAAPADAKSSNGKGYGQGTGAGEVPTPHKGQVIKISLDTATLAVTQSWEDVT